MLSVMPTSPPTLDYDTPPTDQRPHGRRRRRWIPLTLFFVCAVVAGLAFTEPSSGPRPFLEVVGVLSALLFGADFVASRWA